jgi:AcrR family transcriptional regulator
MQTHSSGSNTTLFSPIQIDMKTKASSQKGAAPGSRSMDTVQAEQHSFMPANSYHHGDLRNALIAAGRAALEDLGVRELSLRFVAKAVGVSVAAPSRHFDGKEGLLAAMAAQGFRELVEKRRPVVESTASPEEKLQQMMYHYVNFARLHKGLFNLMVGPRILDPSAYPELKESIAESFRLFADAVCNCAREHGWADDTRNLVVHAAWAVEHGLASLILSGRAPHADWPVDLEDMINFSIASFIRFIAAGPAVLV